MRGVSLGVAIHNLLCALACGVALVPQLPADDGRLGPRSCARRAGRRRLARRRATVPPRPRARRRPRGRAANARTAAAGAPRAGTAPPPPPAKPPRGAPPRRTASRLAADNSLPQPFSTDSYRRGSPTCSASSRGCDARAAAAAAAQAPALWAAYFLGVAVLRAAPRACARAHRRARSGVATRTSTSPRVVGGHALRRSRRRRHARPAAVVEDCGGATRRAAANGGARRRASALRKDWRPARSSAARGRCTARSPSARASRTEKRAFATTSRSRCCWWRRRRRGRARGRGGRRRAPRGRRGMAQAAAHLSVWSGQGAAESMAYETWGRSEIARRPAGRAPLCRHLADVLLTPAPRLARWIVPLRCAAASRCASSPSSRRRWRPASSARTACPPPLSASPSARCSSLRVSRRRLPPRPTSWAPRGARRPPRRRSVRVARLRAVAAPRGASRLRPAEMAAGMPTPPNQRAMASGPPRRDRHRGRVGGGGGGARGHAAAAAAAGWRPPTRTRRAQLMNGSARRRVRQRRADGEAREAAEAAGGGGDGGGAAGGCGRGCAS